MGLRSRDKSSLWPRASQWVRRRTAIREKLFGCPPIPPPAFELVVPVEGLLVRAAVAGEGAPVVLVHGLGGSARCWKHNLDALSSCGKLYVVDLPGFGDSDAPTETLTPRELADVLAKWCLANDIQHASFIGHSLGGEVCLWFAATYPTMVERLVLAASTGMPAKAPLIKRFGRLVLDGFREPLSFLPTLMQAYWKAGPRRILRTIQSSDPEALSARLARVAAPTLVVWGARDPVITFEEARDMAASLKHGRLEIIEEGAHGLIFDAPARFNRLVCHFINQARPLYEREGLSGPHLARDA